MAMGMLRPYQAIGGTPHFEEQIETSMNFVAWKSYASAPALGTRICASAEVSDGTVHCVDLGGFPVLLVRNGKNLHGFVNACPHQYLPLNYKGDKVMSADGTMLRCTNHSASFDIETGEGVEGLGIGCALDPVPVALSDEGTIYIGEAP